MKNMTGQEVLISLSRAIRLKIYHKINFIKFEFKMEEMFSKMK